MGYNQLFLIVFFLEIIAWNTATALTGDVSLSATENEITPAIASEIPRVKAEAEHGDALAQSRLGFTYASGNGGLPKDRAIAVEWWKKAADQGQPAAQCALGDEYYFGDTEAKVSKNTQVGMLLWHKAAMKGNIKAQSELAVAYASGNYKPSDVQEEYKLKVSMEQMPAPYGDIPRLQAAADDGDVFAQSRLGFSYSVGAIGIAKNPELAVTWWKKAAEHGRGPAQRALANAYYNGEGVTQDEHLATIWWHKAAVQGDNQAKFDLARAYQQGKYTPVDAEEENMLQKELAPQETERQEELKRGWLSGVSR